MKLNKMFGIFKKVFSKNTNEFVTNIDNMIKFIYVANGLESPSESTDKDRYIVLTDTSMGYNVNYKDRYIVLTDTSIGSDINYIDVCYDNKYLGSVKIDLVTMKISMVDDREELVNELFKKHISQDINRDIKLNQLGI